MLASAPAVAWTPSPPWPIRAATLIFSPTSGGVGDKADPWLLQQARAASSEAAAAAGYRAGRVSRNRDHGRRLGRRPPRRHDLPIGKALRTGKQGCLNGVVVRFDN